MESAELASADVLLVESKVQGSTCLLIEGMYNIPSARRIPMAMEIALKENENKGSKLGNHFAILSVHSCNYTEHWNS